MNVTTVEPIIKEIELSESFPELFRHFSTSANATLLDSGLDHQRLGQFSFIGIWPFQVLKTRGTKGWLISPEEDTIKQLAGDPFEILRQVMAPFKLKPQREIVPFTGGAIGYLAYDLGRHIEQLPSWATDDLQLPELYFALNDLVLARDHTTGKNYLISSGFPETDPKHRLTRAHERLERLEETLVRPLNKSGSGATDKPSPPEESPASAITSNFEHEEYLEVIQKTIEYIYAGDIFQANISQRLETTLNTPPYDLYLKLRRKNPAPFAAYLNFDEVKVISSSPERFLKLAGDWLETRPIKGTRPRGTTPAEDRRLRDELLNSAKDRAELAMIVDLERNDIGRVCRYGTVRVPEPQLLEEYATVFHLVATVVGQLESGKDRIDLLRACFPGGSITGAPKVRAMEIIEELEPTRRSVYTGSIGYLAFTGDMDTNIVIRTMLVKSNRTYFQAGGGIIADSKPEDEFQETLDKARALIEALDKEPLP
ncbi:MAG: aminodeoxychorismate synthase component I [bacterium]|nr:aminodeoxychorismate synthase component I [bacterium]